MRTVPTTAVVSVEEVRMRTALRLLLEASESYLDGIPLNLRMVKKTKPAIDAARHILHMPDLPDKGVSG